MVVCSMALYSSSPPAPVSCGSHCSTHHSSGVSSDSEAHLCWLQGGQSSGPRQSRAGGLSYLFASPNARQHSSCAISDALESGSLSSSVRSVSQVDHPKWEDGRSGSINIPGSSFGKRSSVSIIQSPYTYSSCIFSVAGREAPVCADLPPLDPHVGSWGRGIATADTRTPVYRREGFEVSQEESKSLTAALTDFLVHNGGNSFVGFDFSDVPDSRTAKQASPNEILVDAQRRHKVFKDPFIIKAFRLAEEAHRGHFRRSGELYLTHCVETAILLASAGAEATVVAAGLLHDTLDDSSIDEAQIRAIFGDDVADLVVGVSKISQLSQLARDNNIASKTLEAGRLRTMFLAMVDVRVVLIKLADRLHNMRTLEALATEKQNRIASETLEILVPIANRLGIWSWKAEMEDLCFKYLNPTEYQELAAKLIECCRGGVVLSAIEQLDKALRKSKIKIEDLCGRSKTLFSIYTKMKKKGRSIDEIYDVRGLRLIVKDEADCYKALEFVHKLWDHIPGKLKDYIKQPKANGYQSLHTVVSGKDGLPLEVQIRTKEMHSHAEFGMAAHWRYKEGNDTKHSAFLLQRVEWARWILTWHSEIMDNKLRVSPSHMDLKSSCPFPFHKDDCRHAFSGPPESEDDPLFVIMLKDEKMIVQELPPGCTAADLVTERGEDHFLLDPGVLSEMTPRVNHQEVENFHQKLRMGDVVEIVEKEERSKVLVTMARVPAKASNEISVYREQIRRMYAADRSCKVDARKSFELAKENTQVAGLT
ncbi:probable GTP diphosphokinase RSH2, chloroplastic [Selaginella moellendorffii]|nr:probable GTP diphosphokinase RSH2, chloroplastic [Selaginella moellendorffii]|eukprot:XP_002983570.2 probable GTP diphosphokinase RSH2, chloroplastic [Selaginella moellendorffii]